jgi:hypothetical protein
MRYLLLSAIALAAVGLLGGCMIVSPPRRNAVPGDDLRLLEPGADRAAVEKALGKPFRAWQPNDEVVYGFYAFHDPVEEWVANRALVVAAEVVTLGTVEARVAVDRMEASKQHQDPRPVRNWWIGFDRQGKVFGHYPQFAILPEHPPQTTR